MRSRRKRAVCAASPNWESHLNVYIVRLSLRRRREVSTRPLRKSRKERGTQDLILFC